MKVIKVSTVPELVKSMKQYAQRIPTMSKKDAERILKRAGVLDENGNPKEQICGDSYYTAGMNCCGKEN